MYQVNANQIQQIQYHHSLNHAPPQQHMYFQVGFFKFLLLYFILFHILIQKFEEKKCYRYSKIELDNIQTRMI